jgi:hypothetical protein
MRESDFRDVEALLIRLNHLARPNWQAALILDRVKLYLANQFDRGGPPLHIARGTCGRRDNYIPVLSTRRRHTPNHPVSIELGVVARRISIQLQSKEGCEARQFLLVVARSSAEV